MEIELTGLRPPHAVCRHRALKKAVPATDVLSPSRIRVVPATKRSHGMYIGALSTFEPCLPMGCTGFEDRRGSSRRYIIIFRRRVPVYATYNQRTRRQHGHLQLQ
jgi:hypothetical protein